jgi:transitional endoplasmic reticulum ATPase
MGQKVPVTIIFVNPDNMTIPVMITDKTEIRFKNTPTENIPIEKFKHSFDDIGGLKEVKEQLYENVLFPFLYPEVFQKLGITPPHGVLIHGPSGVGKTLLGKAIQAEIDANFIEILGPELIGAHLVQAPARLKEIFEEAEFNAPSIIFIDELESLAPKRKDLMFDTIMKNTVSELIHLMDNSNKSQVIILGATNSIDEIEPSLRRSGRFDTEIKVNIPTTKERLEIFQIITKRMSLDQTVDLKRLVDNTHGFTGADITALCREAAMISLRTNKKELFQRKKISFDDLNELKIDQSNFLSALKLIKPSNLREVVIEIPKQSWDDIGGLNEIKELLKESVEYPLKFTELYKHMGTKAPNGVLFFGLPGTGKTSLARAVASECKANFISIKGPELLNKWLGESEAAVREIFFKARQSTPCVVFFDEIDALAPIRGRNESNVHVERVVSQLLAEMDGLEKNSNIFIIGATNRPELIDPALLRPGRLGILIHIPLPDFKSRESIFKVHTRNKPIQENEVWYADLANKTEGFSGADLETICDRAANLAIKEIISLGSGKVPEGPITQWSISKKHFETALSEISSSVKIEDEKSYKEMIKRKLKANNQKDSPRLYI